MGWTTVVDHAGIDRISRFVIVAFAATSQGAPQGLLFAVAGVLGIILLISSVYNVEWLLAAVILYLPLSKLMPAIIAPGLNGTNVLLILVLFAWATAAQRSKCGFLAGHQVWTSDAAVCSIEFCVGVYDFSGSTWAQPFHGRRRH